MAAREDLYGQPSERNEGGKQIAKKYRPFPTDE